MVLNLALEFIISFFSESLPVATTYLYTCYRFVIKRDMKTSDFSVIMTAINNLKSVIADWIRYASELQKNSLYFAYLKEFLDLVLQAVKKRQKSLSQSSSEMYHSVIRLQKKKLFTTFHLKSLKMTG